MKYILYFLFIFNLNLFANDDSSNSYWDKAVTNTESLWNTTKQLTNDGVDGAKNLTFNGFSKTKDIFSQGKKILLEKTLLTSINLALDYNNTIKVNQLSLDDTNGSTLLSMEVELDGEDKPLHIVLKNFDWDVSEDKEFIILENLDISLDIAWLNYLVQEELKKNNGSLKLSYSLAKETFLQTVKQKTQTTFVANISNSKQKNIPYNQKFQLVQKILAENDKDVFVHIIRELYDENYIKPIYIQKNEKSIEAHFLLTGSEKPFLITFEDFDWATANDKKLIVISNIKLKDCNKPWIGSLLKKSHEQIIVEYNPFFEELLQKLKFKMQDSIAMKVK
jgi:hypothetical protein